MKAAVTGIAGFVGGHLAEHLMAEGDVVLGLVSGEPHASTLTPPLAGNVSILAWDLARDPSPPPATFDDLKRFGPDCIYHLAAVSIPDDCGRQEPSTAAWDTNVLGTERVLALAANLPTRPRVLFVSSSHVYRPVTLEDYRVDEGHPTEPAGGYGKTKLAAEPIVDDWVREGRVQAVVARAFQHTGPRQGPRMMLPEWASQFAGSRDAVRVHNRQAYIDLTDVRDVVRAYRLLMTRGKSGETYNVGSGVRRKTGDVLDLLRALADPDRSIVELRPQPKQDPIADISRIVHTAGWQPRISLEQTVADTWNWWRKQSEPAKAK